MGRGENGGAGDEFKGVRVGSGGSLDEKGAVEGGCEEVWRAG